MTEVSDKLRLLGDAWQRVTRRERITDRSCILGTRVGIGVLHEYDIEAKSFPCQVLVLNQPASQMIRAGIPQHEWPADAHSIGVGYGGDGTGWNGHLLIHAGGWLLDLSARQFHRPGRIEMPDPILVPYEGDDGVWIDNRGQRIEIHRLDTLSYREAPDWRRNWKLLVQPTLDQMYDLSRTG